MTFKCETPTGRRCQAEEVERLLTRIYAHEGDVAIRRQIRRATAEVELVTRLLRATERSKER